MILDDSHNPVVEIQSRNLTTYSGHQKRGTEYRFPEMAVYVLTSNMTGTSVSEGKKSHADSCLETPGKKA